MRKILPILTKICVTCGSSFETKLEKRIACSKSCGQIFNHKIRSVERKNEINSKREKTCMKKYGNRHVINSLYTRQKTKEKTGVEYATTLQESKNRWKKTMIEKYGVDNPMKMPHIISKMINTKLKRYGGLDTFNHFKEFIFPSGKIVKIQGYEPKALTELLKTYSENDIIVGRSNIHKHIGTVKYVDPKSGKERYYYPDIYIISDKKVIEVKSVWTFEKHKNSNELKKQAILKLGLDFEFMIF